MKKYTSEQEAAVKRGAAQAMKFSPGGRAQAVRTVGKKAFKSLADTLGPTVKKQIPSWEQSVAKLHRSIKYTPNSMKFKRLPSRKR